MTPAVVGISTWRLQTEELLLPELVSFFLTTVKGRPSKQAPFLHWATERSLIKIRVGHKT